MPAHKDVPDFVVDTKHTLGRLIVWPELSTRLLLRPPFRFLHDIFMEVNRKTRFGSGVLDVSTAKLQTPRAKLAYMSDVIRLVGDTLGTAVGCRPDHVLTGDEARATNEFLQLLALVSAHAFI